MGDSEAEYARRTERIKHLLSSYYGNAGADQAAGGAGAPSDRPGGSAVGRTPGATLDSPAFNPEHHIAQMIKTYSVDRLMAEHRGMAREIKNLDSDMQQLVYENYNKFIAATDTIRAMKENVDAMETDMEQLKTNMDTVAEKSQAVNQKLLKRREDIEELNRVQQLLAKLQAVFELPNRMKAALEEDALGSAVSFYAEALPLLRKYGHKGAFRGVAAEADAAAKQISAALKRRLAERRDDPEQVVLLLRQLGEGDDTLQDKYLQGRAERMQRILQEASLVADAMAATASQQPPGSTSSSPVAAAVPPVDNLEGWGFSAAGAPPSLSRFIKALDERLINAMQETVMNVSSIFLQGDRAAARRKPLVGMAKEVMAAYFKLVRRVVGDAAAVAVAEAACLRAAEAEEGFTSTGPSLNFSDSWGVDIVVQAMSAVTTDTGLLHSQLPELSLRDWAAAATEQAVRGHISAAFGALEGRIRAGVSKAYALLAKSGVAGAEVQVLAPAYNHLSEAIQRGTASLLKGLRVYEQHGKLLASLQEQLSDAVQRQLQALFQSLVGLFLAYGRVRDSSATFGSQGCAENSSSGGSGGGSKGGGDGSSPDAAELRHEPPKTGLVLLLARLCSFMESSVVPGVMELLAAGFQGRGGFRASDQPPAFVGGEVARRLGTAASLLLACYVELHGRSLSLLVQRSVCSMDWLRAAPPRAPRPVCDLLMERLGRAEGEVARLIDTSGRATGPGFRPDLGSHHQRGASSSDVLESGVVERGVAKLFRGKVQPFGCGGLRFSQSAVLAAIIIVGLKSLMEYIRLQTLGKAGLQQLQLDTFYLRPKLLQLVGGADAQAVAQLLDEVVAAGAERSNDPAMLEPATLEKALLAVSRE